MNRGDLVQMINDRISELGVSAAEVSRRAVNNPYLVRNIIERDAQPTFGNLQKLFDVLGLEMVVRRSGEPRSAELSPVVVDGQVVAGEVPLVGFVGADAMAFFDMEAHPDEMVDAPPGGEAGLIALETRGTSMDPAIRDRDVIYVQGGGVDPESVIGRIVVATDIDGAAFVKVLRRGDQRGTWNLESINRAEPTMLNVSLERVAPVIWILCRGRLADEGRT